MKAAFSRAAWAMAAALGVASGGHVAAQGVAGAYLAAEHAERLGDPTAAARYLTEALRGSQGDPALRVRTMLNLAAAGRVTEAAELADAQLAEEPNDQLAALIAAVEDLASGRPAQARARFAAVGQQQPLTGRLAEAWSAYAEGDVKGALAALDAVTERPVFKLFAAYHRGLIQLAEGDAKSAIEGFDAARAMMDRPTARFVLSRARAQALAGTREDALATLDAAVRRGLDDARIAEARAAIDGGDAPPLLVETGAQGLAEALTNVAGLIVDEAGGIIAMVHAQGALRLDPGLEEARLLAAQLMAGEGQPETAIALFEKVSPESPLAINAVIGRAQALERLERIEAAREALRASAREHPESISLRLALGDLLRRAEDWEPCAEAYGAALDLAEAAGQVDWTLYYQRGVCHERGGLWPLAEADLKRALELQPDQPLILNYLGYSWIDRGENFEEGRELIERAVELMPEDGYITDSLGWAQYQVGDYQAAVGVMERAVSLAPTDPVINDHLGDVYWMVGRKREARFQWRRARSFDPDPAALARINRKLEVGLDVVRAEEAKAAAASGDGG